MEQILVHELAHIKRFDPLVNLFQNVIETLLFFHPVVWLVSRQVRLEREHCCDRFVTGPGDLSIDYAKTLIDVASLGKTSRQTSVALAAPGNSPSELQQRIDRILGIRHPNATRWVEAGSAALIAAVLAAFLMMAMQKNVAAQPPSSENPSNEIPSNEKPSEETSVEVEPAALDSLKAEEGKVVGVVVDSEGRPIKDALVDAWTWWKGTEVKTKADGSFVLNAKGDDRERVEIRISKPGFSPYYNHLQPTGVKPTKFVLGNQTFLEGIVTDAEGQPVARAVVRGEQGAKQGDGVMISSVATETNTDAGGHYRMYVFPDSYELKMSAPDKGVARLSEITVGEDDGKTLDIQLSQGVRFEAEVVDSQSGKPVEGFVLWSWQQPGIVGKSDANGMLVIESMLPGKFEFQVGGGKPFKRNGIEGYFHGSFGRWWSEDALTQWERQDSSDGFQRNFDGLSFDLSVGMATVKIEVERGVVFSGKVLDPDGKPYLVNNQLMQDSQHRHSLNVGHFGRRSSNQFFATDSHRRIEVLRGESETGELNAWWKQRRDQYRLSPVMICDERHVYEADYGSSPMPVFKSVETVRVGQGHEAAQSRIDISTHMIEFQIFPDLNSYVQTELSLDHSPTEGPAGSMLVTRSYPNASPNAFQTTKYWLDPSLGYAVVKYEDSDCRSLASDSNVHPSQRRPTREFKDFQQSPQGIWYPTVVVNKNANRNDPKNSDPPGTKPTYSDKTTYYHLDFAAELPDELFNP